MLNKKDILLGTAALLLGASANADLIQNGSFEDGDYLGGHFDTLGIGSTAIDGWTIFSGNIDWVDDSLWNASDGTKSIDMNGNNAGGLTIAQSISTDPAKLYVLTFDMSGNPAGVPLPSKSLNVMVGASFASFTFDVIAAGMSWPGAGYDGMVYETKSLIFSGVGAVTNLMFSSPTNSFYGAVIDNVSITEYSVPEPATLGLLGLGLLGIGATRRRRS